MGTGRTWTESRHDSAVRWIASDDRTFAFVTADGGVWVTDLVSPPRRLVTLEEEPYRVAITDEQLLVGTYSGRLVWVDRADGTAHVAAAHGGPVTEVVVVAPDGFFSSSHDGTVIQWHGHVQKRSWRFHGPVRLLHPFGPESFIATVSQRELALVQGSRQLTLDIESMITGLAIITDYALLSTADGELVSLDLKRLRIASVNLHDGGVRAIAPLDSETAAVSTSTGSMYRLLLSDLAYTPFPI
jgi:hypothetical protein